MSVLALLREAVASAWAAKVSSAMTVVVVMGMVVAVLLTSGRTVGAQQEVLSTLDESGTRAIVVRAQQGAGLDADVLERLDGISSIGWAGAFGPAIDMTNAVSRGGDAVAVRVGYGDDVAALLPDTSLPDVAVASDLALRALGMAQPSGAIRDPFDDELSVVGALAVPEHLTFLEPLVVLPAGTEVDPAAPRDVAVLVVLAVDAAQVEHLTGLVVSVLGVDDPGLVSVETSARLAELRELVDVQLGGASRALVAAILVVTGVLVAAVLSAFVIVRRREFGRRRALGASQRFIATLVMAQAAVLSMLGAIAGAAVSAAALLLVGDPLPPSGFFVGVAVLAVACAVAAATAPAIGAARREPARELRVP